MPKNTAKVNPASQDEIVELQDAVSYVADRDVHLGRVLNMIVSHVARLNGLEYPVVKQEEAPAEQTDAPVEQVDFPAPVQEGTTNAN